MKAEDFIKLSKKQAQDLCENKNMLFRLISIDGESFFAWPEDKRDDRVCCEIENGKVVKAIIQ